MKPFILTVACVFLCCSVHSNEWPSQVKLPDGTNFSFWKDSTKYSRTYYVDINHPEASDNNPGTRALPFETIQKASQTVRPGEEIVIRGGEYREPIRPEQEGTSPHKMIRYRCYPGEEVVIKGSIEINPRWVLSKAPNNKPLSFKLWQCDLREIFADMEIENFLLPNATEYEMELMHWATDWKNHPPFTLPRGMLFQDGQRMVQMVSYFDLSKVPGSFWVDTLHQRLHIHPFNQDKPSLADFEITRFEQLVYPVNERMGYIVIQGIHFKHAGNGFARTNTGAVNLRSGHHWIIENCLVGQVNSVAIEIGARIRERAETSEEEKEWIDNHPGGNQVIGCHIYDCGTGGIQGHSNNQALLANNHIHNIGWQHVEIYYECAAIKLLRTNQTLVIQNRIHNVTDANAIWLDWDNENSRVTRNIIYNVSKTFNGGIFIEASRTPNIIDHNILYKVKGFSINLGDTDHALVFHNLVMNGEVPLASHVITERTLHGKKMTSRNNQIKNNIFYQNQQMPRVDNEDNICNYNLYQTMDSVFDKWQQKGWDTEGHIQDFTINSSPQMNILLIKQIKPWKTVQAITLLRSDYFFNPRPDENVSPGPFEKKFFHSTTFRLWD